MNRPPLQTREQITDAVNLLCTEFKIPVPVLAFSNGRGSRANGKIMHLGMKDWHAFDAIKRDGAPSFDFTFSLLHEFGHVLDFHRKTFNRRDPHGYHFMLHLTSIIQFWYGVGNESSYRWHMDYAKVHAYGKSKGWSNRPWFLHDDRAKRAAERRKSLKDAWHPPGGVFPVLQPAYMLGLSTKSQADYQAQQRLAQPRPYRTVTRPFTGQRVVVTVSGVEHVGRIEWQRGARMRVRVRLDAGGLVICPVSSLKTNSVM